MGPWTDSLGEIYTFSKILNCNEIKLSSWSESNSQEVLVLYTGCGEFIYYYFTEEEPIIKQVPWFGELLHTPVSICFSPSGIFLLVLSRSCHLYILPVLSLVDSSVKNELPLDINDLTIHTYPFSSKVSKNKCRSKSSNSSLTIKSSLPLQSDFPTSSSNEKQRNPNSCWSSFSGSQANVNVSKLKEIFSTKCEVLPSVVCWWQSICNGQEIGIIGTKSGDIIFVDLITGIKIGETVVRGEVKGLLICQDSTLDNVFLLITLGNGEQYKLILEHRQSNYVWSGKQNLIWNEETGLIDNSNSSGGNGNYLPTARARLQELKQMSAEKLASLRHKIAETRSKMAVKQSANEDTSSKYCGPLPENLGSIIGDTLLSPQYSREGIVLAGYYNHSQLLTVHSMNLDLAPLFIHKMPVETEEILLCDRVIYVISHGRTVLQVVSSKLTQTWIESTNDFNPDSVLGKWNLKELNGTNQKTPKLSDESKCNNSSAKPDLILEEVYACEDDERILNFYKITRKVEDYDLAKMYNLEKTEEELPECPRNEGCVVVTNRNVYIVEAKSNMVKLSLNFILETHELEKAERICTIYGIDLQKLLELAGDIKLAALEFPTAIALYKLSKCGFLKSIVKLACGNHCSQVLNYSTMLMANSISDMSLTERIHLSNLILMAYTQQILKNENNRNLIDKFLEFLETNSYFDKVLAVSVTGQSLLFSCLHQLITSKGLILDGYNVLIKLMERFLHGRGLEWTLNKKDFWKCATEVSLIEAAVFESSSFPTYMDYVSRELDNLEPLCLERLLRVLDPTAPCLRPVARTFKTVNDSFDNDDLQTTFQFEKLVELFLLTLLVKLHKTKNEQDQYDRECLLPSQEVNEDDNGFMVLNEAESSFGEALTDEIWPIRKDLRVVDNEKLKNRTEGVLNCGYAHTALIRNGCVYTWGQTAKGCLGHGPTMSRYASPTPVSWLNSFKLEVSVVSCGKFHTAALTNNGLYAWGCSKYGQLGLGEVRESPHPRLVDALANEKLITVCCGQFHTLALTNQGSVFGWGWGVHGQLGLGSIDDQRYPKHVNTLKEHLIVDIAAGHGHSLVLSDRGHVYSFGSNVFGQLGTGSTVKSSVPVLVKGIVGKIVSVATGYFHNLAVTESNTLYTWGLSPQYLRFQAQARKKARILQNQNSLINLSEFDSSKSGTEDCMERILEKATEGSGPSDKTESEMHLSPSRVDTNNVTGKIIQVSCGCHHSALITDSGGLFTWGRSVDGQLGNGEHREVQIPTQINSNGFKADCVSCGCEFTAAQEKLSGKIFCWGSNSVGQLVVPVKESATKSLDGKLVMLKSCKRIFRLLDRNAASNSIVTPKEISEIPPPTFTYHTLNKHIASTCRNLTRADPGYSQRSLHFVIENFNHCINLPFIFKMCLKYNNFQAASKILLLQHKIKRSLIYQLKALQTLPMYRSSSISRLESDARFSKSVVGSSVAEIHLFTIQGGHEDMCDESRHQEVSKLMDDDFVDLNGMIKDEEYSIKSDLGQDSSINRLKIEYIDHAKYILETYLNLNSRQVYDEPDNCSLLETGIQFWAKEKLPVAALENFLLGKLDDIFYDFGYLLFCHQQKDLLALVLEQFSSSFLLSVTSKILSRVDKNESCIEYLEMMSKILMNNKFEGVQTVISKKRPVKKRRPKSQTYLEAIKENLEQPWASDNFIKISYGDVISKSVYYFSCGHYHTAENLKEECKVLEEIGDEAVTSKLVKFYQELNGKNRGDLACPLCVRNYLRQ